MSIAMDKPAISEHMPHAEHGLQSAAQTLAPSGTLRAAINLGNPILADKCPDTGELCGVSVDIARELATRLGLALELCAYPAAGAVVEAVMENTWDIAFLAIDPLRGQEIDYTAPYLHIEGAYLVAKTSPIQSLADVDSADHRIVVGKGSAYDLYLSREIKHAHLIRAATSPTVTDTMLAQGCEVAAGVKQQLQSDMQRLHGLRLLDGCFMQIHQAMAIPKGRSHNLGYLCGFIEELKASGFIARALARHGIEGAIVATCCEQQN